MHCKLHTAYMAYLVSKIMPHQKYFFKLNTHLKSRNNLYVVATVNEG